jgi:hypothetical protein
MNRGLSFWNGALDTAPIDAFEYNRSLEQNPLELLTLQPFFKSQQNFVLIFVRDASIPNVAAERQRWAGGRYPSRY